MIVNKKLYSLKFQFTFEHFKPPPVVRASLSKVYGRYVREQVQTLNIQAFLLIFVMNLARVPPCNNQSLLLGYGACLILPGSPF